MVLWALILVGSSYLISLSLGRIRDKDPGESLTKETTSSQLDGGGKPQFSNKRKSGGEIYVYYSSLLSTDN